MTPQDLKILRRAARGANGTATHWFARDCGVGIVRRARDHLHRLRRQGLVEGVTGGSGRVYWWKITDKGRQVLEAEWQAMDTAPRDGTKVDLCWMDDGEVQESYGPMHWSDTSRNPMVQDGAGIWVMTDAAGKIVFTWTEADPKGAPTHWRPYYG